MGHSGTAITINSHILMSLSRSVTSRSNESDQKHQESGNKVNYNFKIEKDNICNLAQNFNTNHEIMSEESKTNVKSSARQNNEGTAGSNYVQEHEIKNYLTNNTTNQPSQKPSFREAALLSDKPHQLDLEEISSEDERKKEGEAVNLERLYELDTSRFEEEVTNLPTSKKKLLLNQIGNENSVGNHEKGASQSVHQFVDISKFNYSHDQPEEDRNRNNSS